MGLKEQVALVTGGASGMGKATCLTLAKRGCNIALVDLNFEEANRVSQQIKKLGRQALVFKTDVANSKDSFSLLRGGRIYHGAGNKYKWRKSHSGYLVFYSLFPNT